MSKLNIEQSDSVILEKLDSLYRHTVLCAEYANKAHDYGHDAPMTEIEIHTLGYICSSPGITGTELAVNSCRTNGAVSQLVKKLEGKGLIYKEKLPQDKRIVKLYPTEAGEKLSRLHQKYDIETVRTMLVQMLKEYSEEEIEVFFKILKWRVDYFENALRNDQMLH